MSMENFKELPLEVRLSAFIDGQVGEEDARELEALIASNDNARGIYETLKMGSDFGNKAFEEMLKQPVPLELVRNIKAIEAKPVPVRQAANNNVASFMRFIPQAIAASVMLLFAGGYAGYYVAENRIPGNMPELVSETSNLEAPGGEVKTRGMGNLTFELPSPEADSEVKPVSTRAIGKADITLMEVAKAHKAYVADKVHADEVSAGAISELLGYLEAITQVKFSAPDLSVEGYKLRGGKYVDIVGQPSGALFYEDGSDKPVVVYFMKNENMQGMAPPQDGFVVIGGQKDATSYFVAAADEALARKIEESVRAAF